MTSIKQIILIPLLIGGAVSVWVPSVRAHLPWASETTTQGSAPVDGLSGDGSQSAVEVETLHVRPSAPAHQQSSEPGGVDNVDTDGKTQDVEVDLDLSEPMRNFGSEGSISLAGPTQSDQEDSLFPVTSMSRIRLWSSENPLAGLMQSPEGNCAFFGKGLYKEHQQVIPGWSVAAIHSESVVLHDGERDFVVRLPRLGGGLRVRSKVASSQTGDVGAETQQAIATDANAPEGNQ